MRQYPTVPTMATCTDGKVNDKSYNENQNAIKPQCQSFYQQTFFTERKHEYTDDREYPRVNKEQGLVVIFNHERFDNLNERNGTNRDVEEIVIAFSRLGFNIDSEYIYNDLTRKEVLEKITELSEKKFNINCFICIFLSHGGKHNTLYTSDSQISVEEIYTPINKNNCFNGIPKLFLFQACKAESSEESQEVEDNIDCIYNKKLVDEHTWRIYIPRDILLVYATIEGEVAYRHELLGTWFMQEFCRNITAYGRRDDIHSLVLRTTKCVAGNYYYDNNKEIRKQMPIFITTLTKKCYLTMSKDRQKLLKHIGDLKCSIEYLKKIISVSDGSSGMPYPALH